ncbi:1,3-beta-glucan synthase component-domain-containing protein [Scheffersomyces xylosifermentans]|uniref:1,3-beta-glucan synthase component-domain-containing protein n=1 Tax=Scheffersomyces xylosifermentans TaxID=1304137 RepID=UPI00315D6FEF
MQRSENELSDYQIYQLYQDPIATATAPADDYSIKSSEYLEFSPVENQYASWCIENNAPLSTSEIKETFEELGEVFGFQKDNVMNMFDYFMVLLDSRSCRMECTAALLSLHIDYIGGTNSNYKKWCFSCQIDRDGDIKKEKKCDENSFLGLEYKWKKQMSEYTEHDQVTQLALYLLIWGEANNVRFMPECLAFIYKCAFDYYSSIQSLAVKPKARDFSFLDLIISPIYTYIQSQLYELKDGEWKRRQKDHNQVIGYDDVNQFFWFAEDLRRLKLTDGKKLFDYPKEVRFLHLQYVDWVSSFYKTYRETRTWVHVFTNFSRVWIIHFSMFWYYTCFNSPTLLTQNYDQMLDNQPPLQVMVSAVAFGGSLACLISIFATASELRFVPRKFPGSQPVLTRLSCTILLIAVNFLPTCYILLFTPLNATSRHGTIIATIQFVISVSTSLYLAIVPPSKLFFQNDFNRYSVFISSFPKLRYRSQCFSYLLWICVFAAKFSESYFFLSLSLRDPIRALSLMDMTRCMGDLLFGKLFCRHQAKITLVLLYTTDMALFFLDTYLWYIICNCIFSVSLSFSLGNSIFTPWRNIFYRLPERIAAKLVYTRPEFKSSKIMPISHIWNSVIISMYREHLLSIEQVNKLIYQQGQLGDCEIDKVFPPLFFIYQDDNTFSMDQFFTPGKEAERRISFFAQSLSTPLPDPFPTEALPSFTVLIPHFSEKIILGLKEIIKEDKNSKLSLLEYLKQLHPTDWEAFVKDTKVLHFVSSANPEDQEPLELNLNDKTIQLENKTDYIKKHIDDLPFYCLGFKDTSPEYTFRTRIWSSLRCQTLYRTVSGFMNYERAIKLLYRLENNDELIKCYYSPEELEFELNKFVKRKFYLLISMQRYQKFSDEEREAANQLFRSYPSIKLSFLEEETGPDGKVTYYSSLLDVSNQEEGIHTYKYRIKLSGNPILGDGKSDNQNNSLIFSRGEYIQVIDANQDNYLEECLKIKSVLSEFEEMETDTTSEYIPGIVSDDSKSPIAIVGTREYIFSENVGILGDIAAGKEQTFGTLFSRTLAEIGGKLHYGHPDFLNSVFMTTRGGLSKAQKGLHLNEDIYAGMTACCRGGRIKHCDYYQCGKGRDLGFGTILNFTTKIGAGMGEQILSREYFYLGTRLPIDRFLSFYYAHVGFHINNVFIMLSVQLFMIFLINLGALKNESIVCSYNSSTPFTDIQLPLGCYNLQPVINWISRFVLSVFICFFISFMPLIFQEIIEKGIGKAMFRVIHHFFSMAPLFEVFVCQVYAKSLRNNLIFGGARYVATGRGFAISRISFCSLYSRYMSVSIDAGVKIFLTIVFATITMWQVSLLWFWVTIVSMCLAPFIFNPHQFEIGEFFLDYREFIHWLSRGNTITSKGSWIQFTKAYRSRFTGVKSSLKGVKVDQKSSRSNTFISEVLMRLVECLLYFIPYMFINSQNGVSFPEKVNPFLRVLIIAILPLVANIVILAVLFPISTVLAPILGLCCSKSSSIIAGFAHFWSILSNIVVFEAFLFLEGFSFPRTLCGMIFIFTLQKMIFHSILIVFVTRELASEVPNMAWWSGSWFRYNLGFRVLTQPFREFAVKIFELNAFTYDFIVGHCLLFAMTPFVFIPMVDKLHTSMLFWLKPSKKFRGPLYSKKQRRQRRSRILRYGILYFFFMALFIGFILAPYFLSDLVPDIREIVPEEIARLIQPNHQDNNDTGEDNAPPYIPRSKPQIIPMRTVD